MKRITKVIVGSMIVLSLLSASACGGSSTPQTTAASETNVSVANTETTTASSENVQAGEEPTTKSSNEMDAVNVDSVDSNKTYTFMNDQWAVYVANVISNKIIKIEKWDRFMADNPLLKHSYDLSPLKISDENNKFFWLDEEHTAFSIILNDSKNTNFGEEKPCVFSLCINNGDEYKGTDYNESIINYSYQHDDWHLYRAIPLNKNSMKIECWYRINKEKEFIYSWDLITVNENNNQNDFEWNDDNRTSFMLTIQDTENSMWENESLVLFTIENDNYKYKNVLEYLDNQ